MFSAIPRASTYREPFDLALADRVAALSRPGFKIVYYYDFPDSSTFRYRVHNPIELLRRHRPDVVATWFSLAEFDQFEAACERADLIVICRARYTDRIERAVDRFKRRGGPVYFDCDDYVFDLGSVGLLMRTLDSDVDSSVAWDTFYGYVARISGTMALCDRVIVTNGFLAARASARFGRDAFVVDNWLNEPQMRISETVVETKRKADFARDDTIEIGYFSGSPSHNRDFALVVPALRRLMETEAKVRLRLVGYLDLPRDLLKFSDRCHTFPMQTYVDLQSLIGETEINIAPLQDNAFTRCKSALKFFEAAAVETLTVASNVGTLADAIAAGETGLLANAYDWDDALGEAVAIVEDGRYRDIVGAAFRRADTHHTGEAHLASLERALFGTASDPDPADPATA